MRPVLLDNSAWARLRGPTAALGSRRVEVAEAILARTVWVCLPFLLEAGCSARSGHEHEELLCELDALPRAEIDPLVEHRALDAQAQLARVGHHRLPPVDLLQAALAERHALGILHYDADYDVIASKTDLGFESVWLAERGSL